MICQFWEAAKLLRRMLHQTLRWFGSVPLPSHCRASADSLYRPVHFGLTLAIFILSLAIFILSPLVDTADSTYSMVLSESVLHHFSTHLNWFHPPYPVETVLTSTPERNSRTPAYQLGWLHHNLIYCFPNGGSILSLPFVEIANYAGISAANRDGIYSEHNEFLFQRLLASLLMAIAVILVFQTGLLLLDWQNSLLIAMGFAFGTQVWSTATRALWSQTWLIFLGAWVVYLLLRYDDEQDALWSVSLATLLSFMYFVRPTAAIPILCVSAFVLRYHRSKFAGFVIVGMLWFTLFITYSWFTFGEWIPAYYRSSRLEFNHFWLSLTGNLLSPSRGLFVYVPVLALVFYSIARHWSTIPHRRLAVLSLAIIGIHVFILTGDRDWWGGHCYGARLTSDLVPWFVLLAILAGSGAMLRPKLRSIPLGWMAAIVLVVLSAGLNAGGALFAGSQQWNVVVDVDNHPDRVFDWSYPQFAAAFISPPAYAHRDRDQPSR